MAITAENAVAFIERLGIVLESAHGPIPNLAEAVTGEPIRGSWWGHAKGHDIFAATRAARASPDVLVCQLLQGKVTYVHRRLWSALVRLGDRIDRPRLTAVREEHTRSGAHRVHETPFPEWVPLEVRENATRLSEQEAWSSLGDPLSDLLRE